MMQRRKRYSWRQTPLLTQAINQPLFLKPKYKSNTDVMYFVLRHSHTGGQRSSLC